MPELFKNFTKSFLEVKLNYSAFMRGESLTSDFSLLIKIYMAGIIATKLEMTRVIKGDRFIPVTLLKVPELRVVGYKTLEKDGYEAMIV